MSTSTTSPTVNINVTAVAVILVVVFGGGGAAVAIRRRLQRATEADPEAIAMDVVGALVNSGTVDALDIADASD